VTVAGRSGMPRERVFWILLATLAVAGVVGGLLGHKARTVRLTLAPGAPEPVAQAATVRTWREVRFERIAEIPAGTGAPLDLPTLVKAGPDGLAYVLDSGRTQVRKLAPDGRLGAAYGPADLGDPTDVAVAPGGAVWICDPDRGRIVVFSPDGRIEREIRMAPAAMRLKLLADGFVGTPVSHSTDLFQRHGLQGEAKGAFGRLLPDGLQSAITADGWFADSWFADAGASPEGAFVYLFRYAGLLASYDSSGRLLFLRRTVVPHPLPEVQIDEADRPRISADTPISSLSGSVIGNALVVLSTEGVERGRALDVYDLRTGDYRFSLRSPVPDARYAAVTADRLYAVGRQGVSVWSWPGLEAR